MGLQVDWVAPDGTVVQIDPENTDSDSGAVRSSTGFGEMLAAGETQWTPFVDPRSSGGSVYHGGVYTPRSGIVVPIYSVCQNGIGGIQAEIDFWDRITSPELGLSQLRVTNTTLGRVRYCNVYRLSFRALSFSPSQPQDVFSDPDEGRLSTVILADAPSPYWLESLTTIISDDFSDQGLITVENDSGCTWGVYVEAYPLTGTNVIAPRIVNETTQREFGCSVSVDSDQVLTIDWYGTDEDVLSATLVANDATESSIMGQVFPWSKLEIVPGTNVFRLDTYGSDWNVLMQTTPRYGSP